MRFIKVASGFVLLAITVCATAQSTTTGPTPVAEPRPTLPLPVLLQNLSSSDNGTRAGAAWQLAKATDHREEICSALEPLAGDRDRGVRYAAAWALGHLRPPVQADAAANAKRKLPRPKRITRPHYPDAALRARVEGVVVVDALIGEEGEVAHAEVLKSIPALDSAALACAREWQFEPLRVAGVRRATVAHLPVAFAIY